MKVSDLMFNKGPERVMGLGTDAQSISTASAEPRMFTVTLIMNPTEVEVIDGALVFEKRVLATSAQAAMSQAGVRAKM